MRLHHSIFLSALIVLAPGCSSILTRMAAPNSNPIYAGVRTDANLAMNKDIERKHTAFLALVAIDVPLSFTFDTVALPFDLYKLTQIRPSTSPLKDWTEIPAANVDLDGPQNCPLQGTALINLKSFIKNEKLNYGPSAKATTPPDHSIQFISFYSKGSGQHAVEMLVPLGVHQEGFNVYILFFNESGEITKTMKYKEWPTHSLMGGC